MSDSKEKIEALLKDPKAFDEKLKEFFKKLDKDNKGYLTFDEVHHGLEESMKKHLGVEIHCEDHKTGELDAAKKICDPNGTGKVSYDGFKKLIQAKIEHDKKHKK